MKVDVLFIDNTAYKPYDSLTLETEPLGGTEASVIRVAEGLGLAGLNVVVAIHNLEAPIAGNSMLYIPFSMLKDLQPANVVSLRGISALNLFPNAKRFSWQHDLPNNDLSKMRDKFIEYDCTVIGVSKFHKTRIQQFICDAEKAQNPSVKHIYNPVPDGLFVRKDKKLSYNKRDLVWLSSPHKGLQKGLDMFQRMVDITQDKALKFWIFNPGYMPDNSKDMRQVVFAGAMPCSYVWKKVKNSLCVFYPCQFEETFGLVAAEANALHCPVATYRMGALTETISTDSQMVNKDDEKALLEKTLSWYYGHRPEVYGQARFKTSSVIDRWLEVLEI